ncbi:embryonal Fyn-associated substrate [Lepisosteus oculatus]|uniref:embryonal Fyn-associated substrate n=1 Tax=Lepisosteus oculatus TaxID=7918 RepID=UPI0037132435
MALSTVLAKALFDNAAESPDELAFRKGDILMVLERDRGDVPGWWLCSLHGRQGIAPGNRLRLLHTPASCAHPAGELEPVYLRPGAPSRAAGPEPDPRGGGGEAVSPVYLSPPGPGKLTHGLPQNQGQNPIQNQGQSHSLNLNPNHSLLQNQNQNQGHSLGHGLPQNQGQNPIQNQGLNLNQSLTHGPLQNQGHSLGHGLLQNQGQNQGSTHSQEQNQGPAPQGSGRGGVGVHQGPPGGRPRSRSGSCPRPGPDWGAPAGASRARSPSLGLRGPAAGEYLVPAGALRPRGPAPEPLYLAPGGRPAGDPEELYLVPRAAPAGDVGAYQTPPPRPGQEPPGLYQTPAVPGAARTPRSERRGSPRPQPPAGPGTPPSARSKVGTAPGSPRFARKPPPPAPPVRGVPRKDGAAGGRGEAPPSRREARDRTRKTRKKDEEEGEYEEPDDENLASQVYDTPPSSRWQCAVSTARSQDNSDSIYNIPRPIPTGNRDKMLNLGSEVYDVPALAVTSDLKEDTYNIPASLAGAASVAQSEVEEDVYSVPSLPGISVSPCSPTEGGASELYSVPGGGPGPDPEPPPADPDLEPEEEEEEEEEGGIYDMPALAFPDAPGPRRPSVSSTGSGEGPWRPPLAPLLQSALSSASLSPTPLDLARLLTEILSVWNPAPPAPEGPSPSPSPPPPPPLVQARSRLSDLVPALSACGPAPPPEALLSLVREALEDTIALLQGPAPPARGPARPRLPSQESLSRRPLPALPVAEVRPLGAGAGAGGTLGGRKGSWIQERPLPPPPPPLFPLPPAPPPAAPADGQAEDEAGNEYAGIGTVGVPAARPPPAGDSGGYVRLQGKPEPEPVPAVQTESVPLMPDPPTADPRPSPSPPLPVSLSLEDSELLAFYSSQSLAHLSSLADAIDALFSSVRGSQPPRVFVSRGKGLIVTAHKLVFIGDTLSRLLASPDLRAKVTAAGGRLCQALKAVVVATKGAAQGYPSVPAAQEMVDRVAELSQHAAGFSGLLQRLAEIA